jgi:Domain of unknown function (DUF4267)
MFTTTTNKPLTMRSAPLDFWMTIALATFLGVLAARGFFVPDAAARGFGIAVEQPADLFYILVKADRDLSSALAVLVLLALQQRKALGAFVLVATVQPVLDFLLSVSDPRGHFVYALAIHGSAALYGCVLAQRLLICK